MRAHPTLFELPAQVRPGDDIDWDGLEGLALLYTGTATGTHSGIRFAASREHAQVWCSLPVSRGRRYNTEWAYFWTSCANFLRAYPPPLVLDGLRDNGEWDERIEAAGVIKIGLHELADVLAPYGVECEGNPRL